MWKETTAEDVLKVMRNDSKKLEEAMDELEALNADLRKVSELITNAVIRYRKEKLKKKSLKKAEDENAFAELDDYSSRENIRDCYGYDMITEAEMDRLFYLWDLREEQRTKKRSEVYEDQVTKMLQQGLNAIEDMYRDRKEELSVRHLLQETQECADIARRPGSGSGSPADNPDSGTPNCPAVPAARRRHFHPARCSWSVSCHPVP